MCENGGSLETRLSGKSAKRVGLHGFVSYLRQTTHRRMILFTVSRPRKIHSRSPKAIEVAFMPECFTRSWACLTIRLTKGCLGGKRIGNLLEVSNGALSIRTLHLIVWSSLRNNPNWATRIGGVNFESFRFKKGKFFGECWHLYCLDP